MNRIFSSLRPLAGAAALMASSHLSCATTSGGGFLGSIESAAARVLVSDEQENQIGLQVKQKIEQQQGMRYITDPQMTGYVNELANKVLVSAKADRPGVTWQVHVIDDPKAVNAFATPGGYLYVYSGLLLAAENEAEVLGVLGHESGHVVARHSARQMVDTYGLEAIASLALGQNPNLLGQLAASVGAKGVLLQRSRSDEDEADEYGARYTSQAGYDPRGLVTFFEKLQAQSGSTSGLMTWLSDHPATDTRIAHINEVIAQRGLTGTEKGAARFMPMKHRLAALAGTGVSGSASGAPPSSRNPPPSSAPPPANAPPPSHR